METLSGKKKSDQDDKLVDSSADQYSTKTLWMCVDQCILLILYTAPSILPLKAFPSAGTLSSFAAAADGGKIESASAMEEAFKN